MRLFALIGLVLLASCTQPFGNLLKGGSSVPTDIAPLSTDAISTQTLSPIGGSPPSPAQPVPPPSPAPSIVAPPVQDEPASAQEMACRNRGGIWGKAGRLNAMACFQQTKDGGPAVPKKAIAPPNVWHAPEPARRFGRYLAVARSCNVMADW